MANTKSIKKVLEYLKTRNKAVSPSEICLSVSLKWVTIKEVLEILNQTNQIIFLTTGKSTLVKIREEVKNATTN